MINLVKLCVGIESYSDLEHRLKTRGGATTSHVTRMWPKREKELLDGGSLYWVIKGVIQARQEIVGLEEWIGHDGIRRCEILLAKPLIRTQNAPRRAFQGWRYLTPEDAPADLPKARENEPDLPDDLSQTLTEIGVF